MITIVLVIAALLSGYAFRGILHTELVDAEGLLKKLEAVVASDEATLRSVVRVIIADIKARI